MREPSDSAAAAAELLEGLGVRWALIGALAADRYRVTPRLTTDADFLVERAEGIADAFVAAGYKVTPVGDAGEPPPMLKVRGKGDRIDLLFADVAYQEVALERSVDHVLTVEDVVVHKLIAWRPRDRNDIASILEAGHDLDDAYIEQWSEAWQITDRWAQARARG